MRVACSLLAMPTADATLLPPAPTDNEPFERGSTRHIEDIGAHAVLGAMVEAKKRASIPAIELEESADDFDRDIVDSPRAPSVSEVFLKAR